MVPNQAQNIGVIFHNKDRLLHGCIVADCRRGTIV
jgi:hypothetical protein